MQIEGSPHFIAQAEMGFQWAIYDGLGGRGLVIPEGCQLSVHQDRFSWIIDVIHHASVEQDAVGYTLEFDGWEGLDVRLRCCYDLSPLLVAAGEDWASQIPCELAERGTL